MNEALNEVLINDRQNTQNTQNQYQLYDSKKGILCVSCTLFIVCTLYVVFFMHLVNVTFYGPNSTDYER